jgi:hypothetical protein
MRACNYKLGLRRVNIYGGPYRQRPQAMYGVNMAAEINEPADVRVPTADFSVPDEADLLKGLKKGLLALGAGRDVYVGCMGGIGRTGLYLAAMAKILGYEDPVLHVRDSYLRHAVETPEQQAYIANLDVSSLRMTALQVKVVHSLCFWR